MMAFLCFLSGLLVAILMGIAVSLKPTKISTFLLLPFAIIIAIALLGSPAFLEFEAGTNKIVTSDGTGHYKLHSDVAWCPHSCVNVPAVDQQYMFDLHNNTVRVRYFVDLEVTDPVAMIKTLGINPAGGKIIEEEEVKKSLYDRLGKIFDLFAKAHRKELLEVEPGNTNVRVLAVRKILETDIGQELRHYGLKIKLVTYSSGEPSNLNLSRNNN